MSWELQIREKKKEWMKIQELRENLEKNKKKVLLLNQEIRSLSQTIPKKLNEFNKSMEAL